jgi:hypothetical protein
MARGRLEKQPNSRKTPPLKRREEPLGTMALHWKTPPLKRREEPLGTMALHCWLYTVGSTLLALQGKRTAVRFVEVTL